MQLQVENLDLNKYLENSAIINYDDRNIQIIATKLAENVQNDLELVKKVYEFVRDNISHSCDISSKVVTCKASDVLQAKEGLCFAKSHLLAALLRYLKIPTGFCYQKLIFDDAEPNYLTLHGLNAIYLNSINKWIRVDARGNKPGVNAQFNIEREMLAFPVRVNIGEIDYPIIYVEPNKNVVSTLKKYRNFEKLIINLPGNL